MYPHQKTLPPAVLKPVASLQALLEAMGGAVKFLLLSGALDHEATAIVFDQLRSLQASVDEEHSGGWPALIRLVLERLVPLSNRCVKELQAIQDNAVAAFYLLQLREAGKLLESEKMVKRKRDYEGF